MSFVCPGQLSQTTQLVAAGKVVVCFFIICININTEFFRISDFWFLDDSLPAVGGYSCILQTQIRLCMLSEVIDNVSCAICCLYALSRYEGWGCTTWYVWQKKKASLHLKDNTVVISFLLPLILNPYFAQLNTQNLLLTVPLTEPPLIKK